MIQKLKNIFKNLFGGKPKKQVLSEDFAKDQLKKRLDELKNK